MLPQLILWLFITQVHGVHLEKVCPDYTPHYCSCSLVGIAEVKQVKMCLYGDLETSGCHPCPEQLQENVNCNSCSDDTSDDICPICSLKKFGAGNSNSSHIKQQVFFKFAPHQGIFYIQPLQDYPGFDAGQNEKYHISPNVNESSNQALMTNNFLPKLQETHDEYLSDNLKRNLNMSENTEKNDLLMKDQNQGNKSNQVKLSKQVNFPTSLKSFQNFTNGEQISEKSSSVHEEVKNDKPLKTPIANILIPEFILPNTGRKITDDVDERNISESKYNNRSKRIGKHWVIKPSHDLLSGKIRITPFERFINIKEENADEHLENDFFISLHATGDEFKIKTNTGDKCYFKSAPGDYGAENSSTNQIFDFQCSINNVSSNVSFMEYNRDVVIIEDELEKCLSKHSINAFNVQEKLGLIKTSCNVSLPLMILLTSIKLAITNQNESHNMLFKKSVEVLGSSLINKMEFTMVMSHISVKQLTDSDKSTISDKKTYSSINGKIKFEIRIHLKSTDKNISGDESKEKSKLNVDSKVLQGFETKLSVVDFLNYFTDQLRNIYPKNNVFNGQRNRLVYYRIPLTRERSSVTPNDVFPEENNQDFFDSVLKGINKVFLASQIREIKDIIKYSEDEMKKDNSFDRLKEEAFDGDNGWFKSSILRVDNNSEPKFSDDEIEYEHFPNKWPKETDFYKYKKRREEKGGMNEPVFIDNWNENWMKDAFTDSKQNPSESAFQKNDWVDNLSKIMYDNSKQNYSVYKAENSADDKFENEMEQEYNKSDFSVNQTRNNEWFQYWNVKKSNHKVLVNKTGNSHVKVDSDGSVYKRNKDIENENESRNSFKSKMDESKQSMNRPEKNLVFFQVDLPDIAKVADFPNTETENTMNFTLKRVYRDIPRFSRWSSRWPRNHRMTDEIVVSHKSILKLFTLDTGRVKQKSQNFSDILWFQYRTYIKIPQMNKTLLPKKAKNSEIFKMMNASTSSLKKSKMYNSNCETCSVIYKTMLDSGFKTDPKLMENDKSPVIVLMDKPRFVYHPDKSSTPVSNQRKSKKGNNYFTIQINIDLLFLTSDDYKKLSQKNVPETNFLLDTPWRDLRKKTAFSVPKKFLSQIQLLNLSKSLKDKGLKYVINEMVNQNTLIEKILKIVFGILSNMHEHRTTANLNKISHFDATSMLLPTLNSEMTKFKIKTESSAEHKRPIEMEKDKTSSEEFREKIKMKLDAVDYKENGFSSELKKLKNESYSMAENTSSSDQKNYSDEYINKESKTNVSLKEHFTSEYALRKSPDSKNPINGQKEKINTNKREKDQEQTSPNNKQVFHQSKKEDVIDGFLKISSSKNAPNDNFEDVRDIIILTNGKKFDNLNDGSQVNEKERRIILLPKVNLLKQLEKAQVLDYVEKSQKNRDANNIKTMDRQEASFGENKNLKTSSLEKGFSSLNAPIEKSGKSETNASNIFATAKELENESRAISDDIKRLSNAISRAVRSLHNIDPVINFRLTDEDFLHRKKRSAVIPHNQWCSIISIRRNGKLECTIWTFKKKCKLECHPGYRYEGSQTAEMSCIRRGNVWKPDVNRPCLESGRRPEKLDVVRPKAPKMMPPPTVKPPKGFPTKRIPDDDDYSEEEYYDDDNYDYSD